MIKIRVHSRIHLVSNAAVVKTSSALGVGGTVVVVAATSSTASLLGMLEGPGGSVFTATGNGHHACVANAGVGILLAQVTVDTGVGLVGQVALVRSGSGRGRAGGI